MNEDVAAIGALLAALAIVSLTGLAVGFLLGLGISHFTWFGAAIVLACGVGTVAVARAIPEDWLIP